MAEHRNIRVITKHSTYRFQQIKDDNGLVSTYVNGGAFGKQTYMCTVPVVPEIGRSCHIYVIRKLIPCMDETGRPNGTFTMETEHCPTSKVMHIIQEPFRAFDPDTTTF